MAVVSFDVVTFHARGAWPYRDGEMTHSADGTATLASGEIVSFVVSRYHVPSAPAGERTSYSLALYSAARRELNASKWGALKAEIRKQFVAHVRRMADGPRPAAIHPAADAALVAEYAAAAEAAGDSWHIANAREHGETLADGGKFDADATRAGTDQARKLAAARLAADVDAADAAEAALCGRDADSYASPVARPRVGGFATSGDISPIGRAYREGTLDSFMVAAILDWMSPARLARFFERWAVTKA